MKRSTPILPRVFFKKVLPLKPSYLQGELAPVMASVPINDPRQGKSTLPLLVCTFTVPC